MQILELTIYSEDLFSQKSFYNDLLGFEVSEESETSFSIQAGVTKLIFIASNQFTPYHFAINIPNNQLFDAIKWMKSKGIPLLKDGNNEIIDFEWIHARSIYFYDKDNNIVELIARKKLNNQSSRPFSMSNFLEVSEIGLPNQNIEKIFSLLNPLGIKLFAGNLERFAMLGNEQGMFLAVNTTIKDDWIPTGDKIEPSEFRALIKLKNLHLIEYKNNEIVSLKSV